MDSQVNHETHKLPVHEVLLLLEADATRGLTHDEAQQRLQRFGPNVLPLIHRPWSIDPVLAAIPPSSDLHSSGGCDHHCSFR